MKTRKTLVRTTVLALVLASTTSFAQGMQGGMGMTPGQGMQGGMGMTPGQGMQGCMGMMRGQGMQGGMGMMPGQGMQGGMGMMPGQGMQGGMGMMGMMGMSAEDMSPEQLDLMGNHIQSMHEQMSRIAEESDPEARRTLVKEHLASMQQFMRERMKMMQDIEAKRNQADSWRAQMEQRMHRMEEMMKGQKQE